MKKIIILFVAAIITTTFFNSCDKNFEEYNKNIDDPATVPSSMLIGTAVRSIMNTTYSTFNGSEIGENWVQHNALTDYNDPDRYRPRVTSMDAMWNNLYYAASQANQVQELAIIEENQVNQGVAMVIKAYCFLVLTDLFGDVPFTEALKGPSEGNFTPAYDPQETVYDGALAMLDEAMPLLLSGVGTIDGSMDILYGGDPTKWEKFANSLKFRALMRISGVRNVSADLQALVNKGHLFSSNDDEAKLVYLSASPEANPLFETIVDQSRDEHKLSATFVNQLIDYDDPRLPVMCQPAENSGLYVGKPNGYAQTPLPGFAAGDVSAIGEKYLAPEAPGYFLSYTELLLLMAEAAHNGYISGGDVAAEAYYNAAIQNSLNENGVGGEFGNYMSDPRVPYNSTNADAQIGLEKWIALFCQGFEAWTEWRRTGYPVLTPAAEGYISEIPRRLRYESTEVSVNGVNYKAAVASQGADELTTRIWWNQ
jgi:hypothetical protein